MLTDLLLAIAHHLLVFGLLGLLITEMVTIRPTMGAATVRYLAKLDMAFGIVAALVLIVGFSRVFFGIKGPAFYLENPVFWAKIAAFAIVGLLSIPPTMRILRWSRAASSAGDDFHPPAEEVRMVRRFMHYEGMVFFTIPVFAALMARGYGL
jgi:putative membrane protein